jgi:hypothetical protein
LQTKLFEDKTAIAVMEYKKLKKFDLLSSRINLNHTCLKLQVSIEDIKTKHPNRTDLIISMEQSLHEIKKSNVSL